MEREPTTPSFNEWDQFLWGQFGDETTFEEIMNSGANAEMTREMEAQWDTKEVPEVTTRSIGTLIEHKVESIPGSNSLVHTRDFGTQPNNAQFTDFAVHPVAEVLAKGPVIVHPGQMVTSCQVQDQYCTLSNGAKGVGITFANKADLQNFRFEAQFQSGTEQKFIQAKLKREGTQCLVKFKLPGVGTWKVHLRTLLLGETPQWVSSDYLGEVELVSHSSQLKKRQSPDGTVVAVSLTKRKQRKMN